jgi:hypothetical protein
MTGEELKGFIVCSAYEHASGEILTFSNYGN